MRRLPSASAWLRGDNNDFVDPERLPESEILGKELLHIPGGGIWLRRLTSPPAMAAYAFLLLAGSGAADRTSRRRHKERRTGTTYRYRTGLPQSARELADA